MEGEGELFAHRLSLKTTKGGGDITDLTLAFCVGIDGQNGKTDKIISIAGITIGLVSTKRRIPGELKR